ncbi:MAG: FAD binding domain-containing protein, partial [Candidatus Marinimicrobia bacterium]|nr:FAD binding domain-containing protein [Candidatus Neomarinimicrobiota bacterium]MDP6593950.1 FAD binding domain-containing protein [Candidatus Neomarinimicrobiota bacterium]
VLIEAIESLASVQIRSVATVGGNICTASPAGDVSCALVALDADCEILTVNGDVRSVPLVEFFSGVKETVLKKDEVLRSVVVPLDKLDDKVLSGFVKVGTRNSMEIAIVSLAYHILTDEDGIISASGVAVGSVAETVIFTQKACDFIKEKNTLQMTKSDREQFADGVVEYAAPISDMRASEWYRRQVLWNISSNVFNQ